MAEIQILCDASPLDAAIAELLEHAASAPLEVRQGLLRRLDTFPDLVRIDNDFAAACSAWECRVVLQPSDAFLELVLAVRAGNYEFGTVEVQSHGPFLQ